jgi:hypothetical protein
MRNLLRDLDDTKGDIEKLEDEVATLQHQKEKCLLDEVFIPLEPFESPPRLPSPVPLPVFPSSPNPQAAGDLDDLLDESMKLPRLSTLLNDKSKVSMIK